MGRSIPLYLLGMPIPIITLHRAAAPLRCEPKSADSCWDLPKSGRMIESCYGSSVHRGSCGSGSIASLLLLCNLRNICIAR
jgi:hypothetical protein